MTKLDVRAFALTSALVLGPGRFPGATPSRLLWRVLGDVLRRALSRGAECGLGA